MTRERAQPSFDHLIFGEIALPPQRRLMNILLKLNHVTSEAQYAVELVRWKKRYRRKSGFSVAFAELSRLLASSVDARRKFYNLSHRRPFFVNVLDMIDPRKTLSLQKKRGLRRLWSAPKQSSSRRAIFLREHRPKRRTYDEQEKSPKDNIRDIIITLKLDGIQDEHTYQRALTKWRMRYKMSDPFLAALKRLRTALRSHKIATEFRLIYGGDFRDHDYVWNNIIDPRRTLSTVERVQFLKIWGDDANAST